MTAWKRCSRSCAHSGRSFGRGPVVHKDPGDPAGRPYETRVSVMSLWDVRIVAIARNSVAAACLFLFLISAREIACVGDSSRNAESR